jgi:hypothetical protein
MSTVDFTNLAITLAFFAGPAGIAAWAIYWGNLYKNFRTGDSTKFSPLGKRVSEFLKARSPEATQVIHVSGYVVVPVLAKVIVGIAPPTTLDWLQPHYYFVTLLIIGYIGGQFWYAATKEEPAPAEEPAPTATATSEVSPEGDQKMTLQVSSAPEAPAPAVVDSMGYGTGVIDPKS